MVHVVESVLIDFKELEGGGRDGGVGFSAGAFEGVVAREAQEIIDDAGSAAGAAGDLIGTALVDVEAEEVGVAAHDAEQLFARVVVEARLQRKAAAERGGEQAGTGGCADERELREVEAYAARVRALINHDVDTEVLHRRVEKLLDRFWDTVDLVDEEQVAFLEARE